MKKLTSEKEISFRVDGQLVLDINKSGTIVDDETATFVLRRLGSQVIAESIDPRKAAKEVVAPSKEEIKAAKEAEKAAKLAAKEAEKKEDEVKVEDEKEAEDTTSSKDK
jgi:ribosomal protein L12E/L44/L45/RPP1/RPP2